MAKEAMDRVRCMEAMRERAKHDDVYLIRVQWLEFVEERYPNTYAEIMALWEAKAFKTPDELYAFIDSVGR